MSDYMAAQMDAQMDGAICENERLAAEVDRLTAEAAELRRERDELVRKNAELAARLEQYERAEPVAWIEHELQGTGLRHLHFERRPNALRDDVVAPVWTELIARPVPAAAPERAAPTDGCGACGDACQSRASCRLADESPEPCRCGPDSRSDSTSCPRGVMTISVYYFCAEYRDDQLTHSMSGTIQSDMPPFHEDFHARLTERIAANMKPPRPADLVFVRSLSLLATREVEHGDVWARQSGRDDGGHAEHDGTDADAERAYCAAAVGACGRASHE